MLLAAAGVTDEDIIRDYTLSAPFMPELRDRWRNDPAAPPEVLHRAGIELGKTYPQPLVDHARGRERALSAYAKIRKG